MTVASVIVGAPNIERVSALEPEYDPVLIVDAHRMAASEIAGQRMQTVPRGHPQVVETRHRINLVQLAPHNRPKLPRNASSRLAIHAIPDVTRCAIG